MADFAFALGLLLIAHAIGDKLLQPGWLAVAKRPGGDPHLAWPDALAGHATIHGLLAASMLAIGGAPIGLALLIGALEMPAHAGIDFAKCRGAFGMAADQALHVLCKLAWAGIVAGGLG